MKIMSQLSALVIFATSPAWAIFCPNSFNQINPGDSVDVVKLACGKPDTEKTYVAQSNQPQEWIYFLQLALPLTGTIKMSVTLVQNKVISIIVNGIGTSTTQACGGNIQIGSTLETVKAACGKPVLVNQSAISDAAQLQQDAANTMTEITYNSNPPVTLTFKAGLLQQ